MLIFTMLVNEDIADIEKPDGLCSLTFVVDEFQYYIYICHSFLLHI